MNVYLLIAFIAVMGFAVGAGLMALDRYLEKKRDERLNKIICDDVIPAAETALETYTEGLMNVVKKMTEDMMKGFMNND